MVTINFWYLNIIYFSLNAIVLKSFCDEWLIIGMVVVGVKDMTSALTLNTVLS